MKILIPVTSKDIDISEVYEHFGKSRIFALIEYSNGKILNVEYIERKTEDHRVGEIPQMARDLGADIIIVSSIGERAYDLLNEMGITVIAGVNGKVRDVIENIKENLGEPDDRGQKKDTKKD